MAPRSAPALACRVWGVQQGTVELSLHVCVQEWFLLSLHLNVFPH